MAKFIHIVALTVAYTSASQEIFLAKELTELASTTVASSNASTTDPSNTQAQPKASITAATTPAQSNTSGKTASTPKTTTPASADLDKKQPLWTGMHIIGSILMMILITLSNAGGLSGAGSNIPIMLIFFNMGMAEAVPISAFVAVCATTFRFILNFNQKHPNRKIVERNTINYEVVSCAMPAVFFGSLVGVMSGPIIGQMWQMIVFGTTVAWSIYTTGTKAWQLIKKERAAAAAASGEQVGPTNETELLEKKTDKDGRRGTVFTDNTKFSAMLAAQLEAEANDNSDDERVLKIIHNNEAKHFTFGRISLYILNFIILLISQVIIKNEENPLWQRITTFVVFGVIMLLMTIRAVKEVNHQGVVKNRSSYQFDEADLIFNSQGEIAKLAFFCMIAAILCGMTGIAGGMVLGPLFLKYNMLPTVMSATNQYITMIASICVAIQFSAKGAMNWQWAITFGIIALISAFIGIQGVKKLVEKSGKQSIIAVILVVVLILALVSLPIKTFLLTPAAK